MEEDIKILEETIARNKELFEHQGCYLSINKSVQSSIENLLQAYKEKEKVVKEKDKLIESMKNFLFKTCRMADFLEWKTDFDKVKENKE